MIPWYILILYVDLKKYLKRIEMTPEPSPVMTPPPPKKKKLITKSSYPKRYSFFSVNPKNYWK